MAEHRRRTLKQRLKWYWDTRVIGLFRVRLAGRLKKKPTRSVPVITFEHVAPKLDQPKIDGITVILTAYRRTEYLADQVKAIRNQTVAPTEIWVWSNLSSDELRDVSSLVDRVVVSNTNWLFWGRFALGNLARTGYLAFFDDDILPQPLWFENCLSTINNGYDGILGGSGVLLPIEGGYSSKNKVGWNGRHLNSTAEVDLVGHAWFMRKKHLQYMWREEPFSWDNGEDIHLSYMALKYGGIKTFVPPHPENDQSCWSCRPDFGKIVGRKKGATFKIAGHKQARTNIVHKYRQDGWAIVEEKRATQKKTFSGDLVLFNRKLKQGENFSLVRFGDGEMFVINGDSIDCSNKCYGEHKYTRNNKEDEAHREILKQSLLFKNKQYFVGLPCRCCVGDERCDQLRKQSQQDETNLTWANIFVNANYTTFLEFTVPLFQSRTINIVCRAQANIKNLPFAVSKDFRVGANAWVADYDRLLDEMMDYISSNNIENEVFIFCAGVLSNMLIYQLTKAFPKNTYINLGSALDVMMGLGKTRRYLRGRKKRLNKVCIW